MIGMSNAQVGSSADLPFEPSSDIELGFINGQGIKAGELCVVMAHDMTVEGSHGTQMPGSDYIVPSATIDASHTLLGAIGKPHLVSAKNKIMQAFYASNINLTAASGQTVPTGHAAISGPTYLYSVHWDSTNLELNWNTISSQLTYSSDNPIAKVTPMGAFAWGEPYQIDDNYWLITGQFGQQAGPVKDKRDRSWYYPGQINLVYMNEESGNVNLLDTDYCIGLADGTTTGMNPIAAYVPTGRPFVCPIKEDIGFKQVYTKPSVHGISETIEGDIIESSGVQGFRYVKEYTFIYVYNCHSTTATSYTIQARPFKVCLWSEETVFPQPYTWENRVIPNTENGAKLELKSKLELYGMEFIENATTSEGGVQHYQDHYEKTIISPSKKVKHQVSFDVFYDETVNKDYAYHEKHSFSLNTDVDSFTEAEIDEMKEWSQGGQFTPMLFTIGDDTINQYNNFKDVKDKLKSHMGYLLAFTADAGIDCGTGQILYGNYCNFSNLETQHVMFLTSTDDTVATAHRSYMVYHLQYDENELVWSTTPVAITPIIDESVAKWAPGVTTGINNDRNIYGFNPHNKYYSQIDSQKMPLVMAYYNNLNCDNVITSKDKTHKFALFPHYYYDCEVDWQKATVKMTIKAYACDNMNRVFLTKHYATYGLTVGSASIQQSTVNYITDAAPTNQGGLSNTLSRDWDQAIGNITNSYCYNTKVNVGGIPPMVYKLSDTGYAMAYLSPVFGYPGTPATFGSTRRAIVVNIIYFIEELSTFYSPSQYGLIADAQGLVNAAVTKLNRWSADMQVTNGGADYWSQPGYTVPNYPEAVYCRPLVFLTSNDYLQFHTTRWTGSNYYNGCADHTATPLSSNAKSLLVYPVTSIMENKPATATTYQKPILYGVAQNTIGTAQDGELLELTGKVKLHTFLVEE